MSSNKQTTALWLFAKSETTYGVPGTFAATDAVQCVQEFPIFNQKHNYDGSRGAANGSAGNLQRAAPTGRSCEGTVILEGKGLGASYSVSATPPNLHPFLLSAGFSGSVSGSGWLYQPVPIGTPDTSMGLAVYGAGEALFVSGAYSQLSFGTDDAGVIKFKFDVMGMCGTQISDVASPPSRSYAAAAVIPPVAQGVNFQLGSYGTAKVRSFQYTHNLMVSPRINISDSNAHSGFNMSRRDPTLTVVVEADFLSTFDPYAALAAATQLDTSMQCGSVGNNRYRLRFPQAPITEVVRSTEDNMFIWTLTLKPSVSNPDLSDDVQIYFF